jgi:hypothetical protein
MTPECDLGDVAHQREERAMFPPHLPARTRIECNQNNRAYPSACDLTG